MYFPGNETNQGKWTLSNVAMSSLSLLDWLPCAALTGLQK